MADFIEGGNDTVEEIFLNRLHTIDIKKYDLYHFEEFMIDDRKFLFRLSTNKDLMTVVTTMNQTHILLVSITTNGDHEEKFRKIHKYILLKETQQGILFLFN